MDTPRSISQTSLFDEENKTPQNYRETFIELVKQTRRDGVIDLLSYLDNETDFFIAPASTRFHGASPQGLVKHSLQVYYNLLTFKCLRDYSTDQLKIVGLFHDLCKANFYKSIMRNVKNEKTGKWEQIPSYTVSEQFPFGGHGSKSVFILSRFIKLSDEEAAAINCHMGGWDSTNYHNPSTAFEKYPLAICLHMADLMATYINKS